MTKPTQTRISEGDKSKVGKRVLAAKLAAEPRAQDGLQPAPKHLPKRAREVYEFWREQLELMQIDHKPDSPALEAAALAYARAVECEIVLNREGVVINEPVMFKGAPVPGQFRKKRHPASVAAAHHWQLARAFAVEFGLTPAARTKLTIERVQNSDQDVEELLNGPSLTEEEKAKLQ